MTDWRDVAIRLVERDIVDVQYLFQNCLLCMSQDEIRDMLNISVDPIVFESKDILE